MWGACFQLSPGRDLTPLPQRFRAIHLDVSKQRVTCTAGHQERQDSGDGIRVLGYLGGSFSPLKTLAAFSFRALC
ncbi:hypothetical protein SAMN04488026_103458 [Aliiruegeria lutimaris]|uniref:Uncharacterized protein n=1 Tax=Aliiruegeria lutimaris TaxID=571298 RepID=A0A1G9A7Y4_9RHOB|nr:hypothetical protein SAMN04488026_103458 [Aliiruegeria lutimaris]